MPAVRMPSRRLWRCTCTSVIVFAVASTMAQSRFRVPRAKPLPVTQYVQVADSSSASTTPASHDSTEGRLPVPDSIVVPQLDFADQPIQDVLRLLSAPYGINLAVDQGLRKRVTLRLTNVRLREALQFIIEEYGCAYSVRGAIIKVFEKPPAPPVPPPSAPRHVQVFEVADNRLTVDLKDAPLDSIVRWVTTRMGRTVVAERGLSGPITAYFKGMPVDTGLALLFQTNGFELSLRGGVTYLIPAGGGFEGGEAGKGSRMKHYVSVRDSFVTLNVNGAPVADIVKEIARQANLDIYLYDEVAGAVTAKVTSMGINELFESLLRNTNCTFWRSRGTYFFGRKEMYEKKVVELVTLNYLNAEAATGLLPKTVTANATLKPIKEYNGFLIEAPTSDIIEAAREFIASVDKPIAQILIEAWVVEVKLDKLRDFGLKLFNSQEGQQVRSDQYFPAISLERDKSRILSFLDDFVNVSSSLRRLIPADFTMQLDLLESEGVSNVISKPQIATLNGNTANITFGTTQYFLLKKEISPSTGEGPVRIEQRYEEINVDMTLSVTPWVSANGEVTMDIAPRFDIPGASPSAELPPPVNRRSLRSKVRVKDGEMIVLGGLINESRSESMQKVPLLGSIPIIQWLFTNRKIEKSKTQLMIYLIPHIYYGSERTVEPDEIEARYMHRPAFGSSANEAQKKQRELRRAARHEERLARRSDWFERMRSRREERRKDPLQPGSSGQPAACDTLRVPNQE